MSMPTLEPFLKWAGGKRWLVRQCTDFLPRRFGRYFEPFLGGAAMYFHLLPRRATLSDTNADLMNAYSAVKDEPKRVHEGLKRLQELHSPDFYYETRESVPSDPIECAVRFIYLNRTCFNGLYRVNQKGFFNVPLGTKSLVEFNDGHLEGVSRALRHATLRIADFETVIDRASDGDFVFVDPPYTVVHNTNNFIKYNAKLFSWEDQVRLAASVRRAAKRGALIMLSNADHLSIRTLYADFGIHCHVERASVLAGSSEHRRRTRELLITNYTR